MCNNQPKRLHSINERAWPSYTLFSLSGVYPPYKHLSSRGCRNSYILKILIVYHQFDHFGISKLLYRCEIIRTRLLVFVIYNDVQENHWILVICSIFQFPDIFMNKWYKIQFPEGWNHKCKLFLFIGQNMITIKNFSIPCNTKRCSSSFIEEEDTTMVFIDKKKHRTTFHCQ